MRVYLAGPIAGCTDAEMNAWRTDLKDRLPSVEFLDPSRRDYRGREDDNVEDIVENDKLEINTCDVLVAYTPRPSVGTSMEVLYAWQHGKRVLIFAPPGAPVSPWLRYHSHGIYQDELKVAAAILHWSTALVWERTGFWRAVKDGVY